MGKIETFEDIDAWQEARKLANAVYTVTRQNGISLVDAAHIIPFSESHDDDPRNGMALCKNHHWAMDQELIFPCSDNLWHVRKDLDDRIDAQRSLIDLDGKTILPPEQKQYAPKQDALLWREHRLKAS